MGTVAVGVAILLAAAACGSGASAGDRVAKCQEATLDKLAQGSSQVESGLAQKIADDPKVKSAATALCQEAENQGMLEDGASEDDTARLMRTHPELITPICEVGYREGLGASVTLDVASRIPGGLDRLAADYCRDLGRYVQGTAINWPQLSQDRGRETFVAVCTVSALGSTNDPNSPFSESDARKLFTRVCGKAWDEGYASADGSYDSAAVRRLARQTLREMVRSGEIHVRQT
jgi:hypothetical protein